MQCCKTAVYILFVQFIHIDKAALTISPFGPAGPETPAGPIRPFKHEQKMTHVSFNRGDGWQSQRGRKTSQCQAPIDQQTLSELTKSNFNLLKCDKAAVSGSWKSLTGFFLFSAKFSKFVDLKRNKQRQVNVTVNPSCIFRPCLGKDSTKGLLDILLFRESYFSAICTVIIVHAVASHHALLLRHH